MDMNNIEQRLSGLEAAIYQAQPRPKDTSADVARALQMIDGIQSDIAQIRARTIPSIKGLVSHQDLQKHLRVVAELVVDEMVSRQKSASANLTNKIDTQLGKVHGDVQSARNAALSFGTFASDMLRQKSAEFAR